MRTFRTVALGATLPRSIVGACTSGGGTPSPSAAAVRRPIERTASEPGGESPSAPAGPRSRQPLDLGGPPECPQRPFCLLGLRGDLRPRVHGVRSARRRRTPDGPGADRRRRRRRTAVHLRSRRSPPTASSCSRTTSGSSWPTTSSRSFAKRSSTPSGRRRPAQRRHGQRLTQEELTNLNKAVTVDARTAADVAPRVDRRPGLRVGERRARGTIVVGSTNFYEQEILGEIFAQVLETTARRSSKFQLGNREVVFPALERARSTSWPSTRRPLEFVNDGAGEATTDPAATTGSARGCSRAEGPRRPELRGSDGPERLRGDPGHSRSTASPRSAISRNRLQAQ